MQKNCHYQHGNKKCKVAFVFSCPGSKEEDARHPAAGRTGDNLNSALVLLSTKYPYYFPWKTKDQYRITNAWPRVEYNLQTGRTEARKRELRQEDNLRRLRRELQGMRTIVACGRKACFTLGFLKHDMFSACVIEARHLSSQALNTWKVNGLAFRNQDERIQAWVKFISIIWRGVRE